MRYDDLYDLIEVLCEQEIKEYAEINECSIDLEKSELEDIFYEKFDIDLEQLYKLVENLLPLCERAKSELTGIAYRGFGKNGIWLIRDKV